MVWCGIIVCYDMEEWRSMVWSCEGIVWYGIEESMGLTDMSAVSGSGWKLGFFTDPVQQFLACQILNQCCMQLDT